MPRDDTNFGFGTLETYIFEWSFDSNIRKSAC